MQLSQIQPFARSAGQRRFTTIIPNTGGNWQRESVTIPADQSQRRQKLHNIIQYYIHMRNLVNSFTNFN